MLNATRLQLKNHFSYLQQFMASPRTIGTLAPSSPWLCQAMLNQIEWTGALSIAELGAADGVLTKRILGRMRADASLEAFEIHFTIPGTSREFSVEQLSDSLGSVIGVSERLDLEGTKSWRLKWWGEIRDYTVYGPFFWQGKGYGINLADSDGFQVGTRDEPLRSPHNSHLTFLARSGVPGFVLWILLQGFWAAAMFWSYIKAAQRQMALWSALFSWLMAYWLAFVVSASFDVFLEGPMAGIPFWSLFGMGWGAHVIFRTYLKQRPEKCLARASAI